MPRAKQKPIEEMSRKELYNKAKWGGYVPCELTAKGRKDFEDWQKNDKHDVMSMLDELILQGYDVKFVLDRSNESVIASLTYVDTENWAVWVLTAFHQDLAHALELILFKHFRILGGTWENSVNMVQEERIFG